MWDNNVPWVWEAPTPTKEETLTLPTTTHCSDPVYKYKLTNTKVKYNCEYKNTNRQFFKRFYQRRLCQPLIDLTPRTNTNPPTLKTIAKTNNICQIYKLTNF